MYLCTKYIKFQISYKKLNKKLKDLATKHIAIVLNENKFTKLAMLSNFVKIRKIIKNYINFEIIFLIRQNNTYLFFCLIKKIKKILNIDIKDFNSLKKLMNTYNFKKEKGLFTKFIDLFKLPEWLNQYLIQKVDIKYTIAK